MLDTVYTIGFTQKTAERFFGLIERSGAQRIVDVRLNNVSQLAGFAKRDDLKFFLKRVCNAEYLHLKELAPTQDMLDGYKKGNGSWMDYQAKFIGLMKHRQVEKIVSKEVIGSACLLCSEHDSEHCHRRIVAEYLQEKWGMPFKIEHLK